MSGTPRILVVGAGAIGGYFGARLMEAGQDVTFLVRARRAAQLAEHGLVVRSARGDAVLPAPRAVLVPDGAYDAVIVSCKAFDLPGVIDAIGPAVDDRTLVLPLLNGMAHLGALAARFGEAAVLGGQCQISTTLEADGTVRQFGDMQSLSLGVRSGEASDAVLALAAALVPVGGRLSEDIVQEMWEKWVFIATVACTTCLMRATIGDVVAGGAGEVALGLVAECAAIAMACGHAPRPAQIKRLHGVVTTAGSPFAASMLRDVERGAPVEAEHIVADLVRRGAPGSAPLLRLALLHLRTYEARRVRLGVSHGLTGAT